MRKEGRKEGRQERKNVNESRIHLPFVDACGEKGVFDCGGNVKWRGWKRKRERNYDSFTLVENGGMEDPLTHTVWTIKSILTKSKSVFPF